MFADVQDVSPVLKAWRPIFEHFQEHVRNTPGRLAVQTEEESLTYLDLARRIEIFAARLAARLTSENRLVALHLARNADLPAWLLAVHRVGGAYLPLDPSMPGPRLVRILEDAEPALIVANRTTVETLPAIDLPVMIAEEHEILPPAPAARVSPDTLAYLIYTSGSTGIPKGVEIEHRSLTALMTTMARSPGLAAGEKMLGLTRISFDLSVPDMFLPFMVGGCLSLIDLETASDPDRLAAAFDRYRPDLVQGTPSTWRALVEVGWRGLLGLRLLAGGEAMTRDLADELLPRCGELWNIYGPTETTVWSTACQVKAGSGPVPIGWPMIGISVFVTDRELRSVPDGEVGEIVIGGPGVARGYRNRPELNADRFVELADGMRVYRTGDLGRFDTNGALFCLGRSDDQVKVRGFRVELGDVEAALSADPTVSWAAARLWTDPAGSAVLTGYVVAKAGEAMTPKELKKALALRISDYMIPDRILRLSTMPLTPNGKIDRAALPSPFSALAPAARPAGAGTVLEDLAAIWCDLLSVRSVSKADDFFELGGYSLMTVRLTRRIRDAFGVKLAVVDLMRFSKLGEMADRIERGGDSVEATMLLNGGGARQPLYWVDAGPLMQTMARAMPDGQPMIALNLTEQDETDLIADDLDIESVAARLARHLTAVAPTGPILLGGWCRWGVVAFELALQLQRDGREVATLVLLDADHPATGDRGVRSMRKRVAQFMKLPRRPAEPLSFSMQVEQAVKRYRPASYGGKVLLIRPSAAHGDGGWTPVIGKHLSIASTPGDHESMVRRPYVSAVAAVIGDALAIAS